MKISGISIIDRQPPRNLTVPEPRLACTDGKLALLDELGSGSEFKEDRLQATLFA